MSYTYDAASRLATVTDWDFNVTSYSYDDAGRMIGVELPNGIETSFAYDDGDRLTGIDHVLDTTSLAFVEYTLDNVGNRTERLDAVGTHTYAYDDVYRLTSVTYPGPSTTTYSYDDFGNRTAMTVGSDTTTYAYDDAEQLTSLTPPSASPITYDWDDNGNLVERGSDTFAWDYENRLTEVTVGSTTTEFAYRGDGLRHSRTVGMGTTVFTWDIAAGIPVVLDDEDFRYVYGAHGLIAQKSATDDYYLLSDGLGSTMAITDDQWTVVRDYQYDVFGEVVGGSGSVESEFQFAGEQVDGSTGLQYLRNRYYDMETGRFISRDPLSSLPGWVEHPYMYASANPVNLVDPLGLCGWKDPVGCIKDAGAAVGGAFKSAAEATASALGSAFDALRSAIGTATGAARDALVAIYDWAAGQVRQVASLIREYAGQIAEGCIAALLDCAIDLFTWVQVTNIMVATIVAHGVACAIVKVTCPVGFATFLAVGSAWVVFSHYTFQGIAERSPSRSGDPDDSYTRKLHSMLSTSRIGGHHDDLSSHPDTRYLGGRIHRQYPLLGGHPA